MDEMLETMVKYPHLYRFLQHLRGAAIVQKAEREFRVAEKRDMFGDVYV